MRHHVGLHLRHEVHRDDDNDQQRRSAEVERHRKAGIQELGHQAHERDVDGPCQRQPHQDLVDVARGLVARPDPRHERTALLQVVGRLLAVEDQRRIEEAEEHDQRGVQEHVQRLPGRQRRGQVADPACRVTGREPARQRRREQDQRRGEDRRNHARHVELERQERTLAAVDLVADLALGVVDRDLALAALDEHHEGGDEHDQRDDEDRRQRVDAAGAHQLEQSADRGRQSGHDAGEDQDRDTVAQARVR